MQKLKQKKRKKILVHHFHHVTETDGRKKHVYLGTDPEQAKDNLTRIRVSRLHSNNRLVQEIEDVQARLNRLGHYNRKHDDILKELRLKHNRQVEIERIIESRTTDPFSFFRYAAVFFAVMALTAGVFFLFTGSGMTGAAVEGAVNSVTNKFVATAGGMLLVIVILGLVLHHADNRHRTRHDKYKPEF